MATTFLLCAAVDPVQSPPFEGNHHKPSPSSAPFAASSVRRGRFRVSESIDPTGHRHSVYTAEPVSVASPRGGSAAPTDETEQQQTARTGTDSTGPDVVTTDAAAAGSTGTDRSTASVSIEGDDPIAVSSDEAVPPPEQVAKVLAEQRRPAIERLATHGGPTTVVEARSASAVSPSGDTEASATAASSAASDGSSSENDDDDDLRRHHRWDHMRTRFHDVEALIGAKPISEMTDEEIFDEAHRDHVDASLGRHTTRRRLTIQRLAKEIEARWHHFADGGDAWNAPKVNKPKPKKPHELRRTIVHKDSEAVAVDALTSASSAPSSEIADKKQRKRKSHKPDGSKLHHELLNERIPPQSSRKPRQSFSERYPSRSDRRALREHIQKLPRHEAIDLHHREDPSRCFAAAGSFCPGLGYAFAEFLACAVVNKSMFAPHDAYCLVSFVALHEPCVADMLVHCSERPSHETLQCLADLGDRQDALVQRGTALDAVALPLTSQCFDSEIMEIVRGSSHIKGTNGELTDEEKEIVRRHEERHVTYPDRRHSYDDDPELDDDEEHERHLKRRRFDSTADDVSVDDDEQRTGAADGGSDEWFAHLDEIAEKVFGERGAALTPDPDAPDESGAVDGSGLGLGGSDDAIAEDSAENGHV